MEQQQLQTFFQLASNNQLVDCSFQAATLYEQSNQNLDECCAKLSIHLHTIEEQLYDKIWNAQQGFIECVQQVTNLQQQLSQLSFQVMDTKRNLSVAATETYLNGEDISSLEQRRNFLQRIQNSLVETQKLIRTSMLAQVALNKDQLSECHQLCKQFESILLGKDGGDLTKLSCLKNLRDRVTKVAVECMKRVHRNLASMCRQFSKEDFWTVFIAYEEFGAAEALALRLEEEYTRAIADVPTQFEVKYAEERTKERHCSFLLFGFQLFGDILVSFHSLVGYLHDIRKDNAMTQVETSSLLPHTRKEFVELLLARLISKGDFWQLLEDKIVKWLQEIDNIPIAVSSMYIIYNAANVFQALGDIFVSCSRDNLIQSSTEHSTSRKLVAITEQYLQKSFEHQHEDNVQIFRKNLVQETWQRIIIEATDFTAFQQRCELLANSSSTLPQDFRQSLVKLLEEEKNPLRVLNLENSIVVDHSTREKKLEEDNTWRCMNCPEQVSYIFVSSCLILLNIVTRYFEFAIYIPFLRASILSAVGHLLQIYFCHVYSICNLVCRQTEVELEKQERGRELALEDFLHSKDRALVRQIRKVEDVPMESLMQHSNITKREACVAVESWRSLTDLFSPCWKLLETTQSSHVATSNQSSSLRSWKALFALTVPIRSAVYDCLAAQIIEARRFIQEIANNNYSLHASNSIFQTDNIALQDQPSTAIARVLQNIEKWKETEPMPPGACLETLWERIAATCCHTFVVGVSKVKHCTPEGRARMLVDLRHLERGLEELTGLRPIPGAQRAASHIRAYFLDEQEILSWVETEAPQFSFTDAQLENLIETGVGRNLSRNAKNHLIQKVLRIYHQAKQNESQFSTDVEKDHQTSCSTEENNDSKETTITTRESSPTDDAIPMDNILGKDVLNEIFSSDQQ